MDVFLQDKYCDTEVFRLVLAWYDFIQQTIYERHAFFKKYPTDAAHNDSVLKKRVSASHGVMSAKIAYYLQEKNRVLGTMQPVPMTPPRAISVTSPETSPGLDRPMRSPDMSCRSVSPLSPPLPPGAHAPSSPPLPLPPRSASLTHLPDFDGDKDDLEWGHLEGVWTFDE